MNKLKEISDTAFRSLLKLLDLRRDQRELSFVNFTTKSHRTRLPLSAPYHKQRSFLGPIYRANYNFMLSNWSDRVGRFPRVLFDPFLVVASYEFAGSNMQVSVELPDGTPNGLGVRHLSNSIELDRYFIWIQDTDVLDWLRTSTRHTVLITIKVAITENKKGLAKARIQFTDRGDASVFRLAFNELIELQKNGDKDIEDSIFK